MLGTVIEGTAVTMTASGLEAGVGVAVLAVIIEIRIDTTATAAGMRLAAGLPPVLMMPPPRIGMVEPCLLIGTAHTRGLLPPPMIAMLASDSSCGLRQHHRHQLPPPQQGMSPAAGVPMRTSRGEGAHALVGGVQTVIMAIVTVGTTIGAALGMITVTVSGIIATPQSVLIVGLETSMSMRTGRVHLLVVVPLMVMVQLVRLGRWLPMCPVLLRLLLRQSLRSL